MKKKSVDIAQNIHHALNLNGNPESVAQHYDQWANTYDQEVIENYYGIQTIVSLAHKHVQSSTLSNKKNPTDIQVVDVGCGTGLLGAPLHKLGYTNIDGIDLSAQMIEKAKATGLYNKLHSHVNINNDIPSEFIQRYDIAICLGVFTPGHVNPTALHQLISMTRQGGLVVISTRVPYYDSTAYQAESDLAVTTGSVTLSEQWMDAPYRDDGDAHYWVYTTC